MSSLLYCFISHNSVLQSDLDRISNACKTLSIKDYYIICGGFEYNSIEHHCLKLNCSDVYEGLSDKINQLFKFLTQEHTKQYQYYLKIDRLTSLIKCIDTNIIDGDYCGHVMGLNPYESGNRWWHKNKCSASSKWNDKPYTGFYVPWCRGGSGYILSHKAAKIIGCSPPNLDYDIYEDLYVAKTLLNANIKPKSINQLKNYLVDPDWKGL